MEPVEMIIIFPMRDPWANPWFTRFSRVLLIPLSPPPQVKEPNNHRHLHFEWIFKHWKQLFYKHYENKKVKEKGERSVCIESKKEEDFNNNHHDEQERWCKRRRRRTMEMMIRNLGPALLPLASWIQRQVFRYDDDEDSAMQVLWSDGNNEVREWLTDSVTALKTLWTNQKVASSHHRPLLLLSIISSRWSRRRRWWCWWTRAVPSSSQSHYSCGLTNGMFNQADGISQSKKDDATVECTNKKSRRGVSSFRFCRREEEYSLSVSLEWLRTNPFTLTDLSSDFEWIIFCPSNVLIKTKGLISLYSSLHLLIEWMEESSG